MAAIARPLSLAAPGVDRVYTVGAMIRQVERQPRVWNGRIVRVRGRIVWARQWSESGELYTSFLLIGADDAGAEAALPLVMGNADPLLAAWRQVPVLGALAPAGQALQLGKTLIHFVQVRILTSDSCPGCMVAALVDPE
jgi:hypothetical protein